MLYFMTQLRQGEQTMCGTQCAHGAGRRAYRRRAAGWPQGQVHRCRVLRGRARTRRCCRWRSPTGAPCAPVLARAVHAPGPGAIAAPAWRCGSWEACGRRPGRCCGRGRRRGRWPVRLPAACCRMATRASAPASRTGPGAYQVQLQAAAASWCVVRSGPGLDVDPGKRYRRRSAMLRPWPATLTLARCSMRARRWLACCSGHESECIGAAHC